MALPVQSVRADPSHRDLLQRVAEILRSGGEPVLRKLIEHVDARPIGPFRDEAAAIGFLRDRLVVELKPMAIWLFGSRARGDARADSDFDLLVVLPDGLSADAYSHERVAGPVVACGLGSDVVPCSWTELRRGARRAGFARQSGGDGRAADISRPDLARIGAGRSMSDASASFIALAREDLAVARKLIVEHPGPAAFHVEQAAEKLLKAVLTVEGIVFSAGHHQLGRLAETLPADHVWRADLMAFDSYTTYATATRYPRPGGGMPRTPSKDVSRPP